MEEYFKEGHFALVLLGIFLLLDSFELLFETVDFLLELLIRVLGTFSYDIRLKVEINLRIIVIIPNI